MRIIETYKGFVTYSWARCGLRPQQHTQRYTQCTSTYTAFRLSHHIFMIILRVNDPTDV
jgi:hypothetical protein